MLSFISAVRELTLMSPSEEAPVTFGPVGDALGGRSFSLQAESGNTNVRVCGEPKECGPPSPSHSWVTGSERGDDLSRFAQMVRAGTQGFWVSRPLYPPGCLALPSLLGPPTGGLRLTRTLMGRGSSLPSGCFLCPVSS